MARILKKGATSQSVYLVALDSTSTTGGRKTGLAYNTSGLTAYYVRNGGSATAITLATLAAANSAYSSGGFKEVDATNMPGLYRLDLPDAAVASGADSVVVTLKGATGMVQIDDEIQLVAWDPQDSVRGGLTALPNAAAEASGGLITRGTSAGQLNVSSGIADANVKQYGGSNGTFASGRPEVNTTHVAGTAQTARDLGANLDTTVSSRLASASISLSGGAVTVGTNNDKTGYGLSASAVQAIWDALTSALTTAGSIGKLLVDNINATISSRLASASYTAPPSASTVAGAVWDEARASHTTAGSFGQGVASVQGNVTGSVGSVTGAVGSVTGNVGGNVVGSVASVTAGVTVTTNNDKTGYSIASAGIGSGAHAAAELNAIADALLDRNMATGTDSGTDSTTTRTPRQALRALRNKVSISAGTMTVTKEDDSTPSFTAAVTTTAGNPVSAVDPT